MNTMLPLIIELLTEELPPKKLQELEKTFTETIKNSLEKHKLIKPLCQIRSFSTPRRLAAYFSEVSGTSSEENLIEKIMPKRIGLYEDGRPTPALIKKLSLKGIDANNYQEKIKIEHDGQQDYLILNYIKDGRELHEILQQSLQEAIDKISSNNITMRYQTDANITVKFVRPVHNILVVWGSNKPKINLLEINSTSKTFGHRFLSNNFINIEHADQYESIMESNGRVIPSFYKRKEYIRQKLLKLSNDLKMSLGDEYNLNSLLEEVTALVEYPSVYIGSFDKKFLELPKECLVLTMRIHQKYFPLFNIESGFITNKFLIVSNINPINPNNIISGNQKVIKPRLEDAQFFYNVDKKRSPIDNINRLKNIIYYNKLGSQFDRVERLRFISKHIANIIKSDEYLADRAALLSKTDLESLMVGEFPELQGIMGSYYAKNFEEPEEVVLALKNQYANKFDITLDHRSLTSAILFLAERVEMLVGFFGIGLYPNGESDPFGLRRAAIGIISIFEKMKQKPKLFNGLNIHDLIKITLSGFDNTINIQKNTVKRSIDFIYERYRYQLFNKFEKDIVESVVHIQPPLHQILSRIEAITLFKSRSDLSSRIFAMNKRVINILKKDMIKSESVNENLLIEKSEKLLFLCIKDIENKNNKLLNDENFTECLTNLTCIENPIEAFFKDVMIMTEDKEIRDNRMSLLNLLKNIINSVGDVSLINL
ncbi:glycyl-tRNA synthetase beta chain [Candidatus Kinetoplastibacterium blastocrithidii TCC012E]|uniref:Glycine--tRNA ligase beta subunit n=1 Tax=Candidatus Kinetoplastidibacterium blastocrithidiae TCC012E TaxID=1208922 RepID=M1LWT8_9PROT|nr:glycine--tRNA ligase subunit beta [Candidatus Kinetoplastibacterium blastocrithidii]AFZ83868.1 glycyl-tRNA synthetase subunit beta [Candidatus Kinetoplastibacterium blastocrithidii (ex Strigomonas culicis)]AGF49987.1 glycyl-tRNA synthetase beta chain [Candidatus Kinetoplastibacterium blastocrithidii TCC012E]